MLARKPAWGVPRGNIAPACIVLRQKCGIVSREDIDFLRNYADREDCQTSSGVEVWTLIELKGRLHWRWHKH